MPTRPKAPVEFSRQVLVDGLTGKGRRFAVTADARERAALARRLGLLDLARLDVAGDVTSIRGGTVVQLTAHMSAEATQACVVTLAPVSQQIETDFLRLYADDANAEPALGLEVHFHETDDDIDPLENGRLDVGEAAAEQLALELDPYPRSAEATLDDTHFVRKSADEGAVSTRPFAGLGTVSAVAKARKKRK